MSLDSLELVLAVDEDFAVTIPDEQAATLATVGQMHLWLCAELTRRERPNRNPTEVYYQLRQVICRQLAVAPDRVTPGARVVDDLGVN